MGLNISPNYINRLVNHARIDQKNGLSTSDKWDINGIGLKNSVDSYTSIFGNNSNTAIKGTDLQSCNLFDNITDEPENSFSDIIKNAVDSFKDTAEKKEPISKEEPKAVKTNIFFNGLIAKKREIPQASSEVTNQQKGNFAESKQTNVIEENKPKYNSADSNKIDSAQEKLNAKLSSENAILNESEIAAALQSKENKVLLDIHWALQDAIEAEKDEENANNGIFRHDIKNSENVNVADIYKNTSSLFADVFKGDEENTAKAKQIALSQAEILSKYAGADGTLNKEKYETAIHSDEYLKTIDEYLDLRMQSMAE